MQWILRGGLVCRGGIEGAYADCLLYDRGLYRVDFITATVTVVQKRIAGLNRVEEQKEGARFNWYVNRVSLAFAVRTGERAYKGRAGRLSFMRARTRWLYHTLSPR